MAVLATSLGAAPGCHAVESDRIFSRDLATLVPEFQSVNPEVQIGFSPKPGATRLFTAGEIVRLARAHGIVLPAPIAVCFERAVDTLSPDRVLEAMKRTLPDASIEVLDFGKSPVPPGELEFPVHALARASATMPHAPVLWRGAIRDGSRSYPVWARVRVIRKPDDVTRGGKVTVRALSGSAQLSFEATAESAGRSGDLVTVRNPWNGRRFRGRVEGAGKVVVE